MSFVPKTWVGRSVQYPGRIRLIPTGENGVFDVQRAEGEIVADGDLVSDVALNDLEQRILTAILSKADGTGGAANNALALGGVEAANYAQVSSGAWTPEIKGTTNAGVATYSDQWGNFTKIGNLCHVECAFALTSLGGATGNILIYGLPFGTYNSMSPVNIGFYFGTSIPETHLSLGGYTVPNSNFVQLTVIGRNGSENLKNEYITDNFQMGCLSCDYIVGGG